MEQTQLQQELFRQVKIQLASHLSLVDEVAGLLDISTDSAYRRIRGEKPISLEDIQKLCSHFKLSLDEMLNLQTGNFIFSGPIPDQDHTNFFEIWMQNVVKQMEIINGFRDKHIFYLLKDLPFFKFLQIPELAAFKYFLWMKSLLQYENMKGAKFSIRDSRFQSLQEAGMKALVLYNRIPASEVWNIENINTMMLQIEFYRDSGIFQNPDDIEIIYDKLEELINHMEKEAEFGKKFAIGQQPGPSSAEYRMYNNELILGDNTFLAELDGMRLTFINHGVLHIMYTKDKRYNDFIFDVMDNIIKKSSLISTVGERERIRFFKRLRNKIYISRNRLSSVND